MVWLRRYTSRSLFVCHLKMIIAKEIPSFDRNKVLNKIKKTNGCWYWEGFINDERYGSITINKKNYQAHRLCYELFTGNKIPLDMCIDHICRNRSCVNPQHLEIVTNQENLRRGNGVAAINRRKTHCIRRHEFNSGNTAYYFDKTRNTIRRTCIVCKRAREIKARRLKRMTK